MAYSGAGVPVPGGSGTLWLTVDDEVGPAPEAVDR